MKSWIAREEGGRHRVTFTEAGREVGSVSCTSFALDGGKLTLYEGGSEIMTAAVDMVGSFDDSSGTSHYAGEISDGIGEAATVLTLYGCLCKAEYGRLNEILDTMSDSFGDGDTVSGLAEVSAAVSMIAKGLHRLDDIVPDDVYQHIL